VVGASSGIGAAIARQLGAAGCRVALVARREQELHAVADAINAGGEASAPLALPYPHDVTAYAEVPALFQRICRDLGGLDLIVYAAGVMPRIADDEYAFEKDRQILDVNVLGAVAWLNEAAQRFGQTGAGTIVGISSVAGDRGRRGNPVYCTSKAALTTYLEALRNRVGRAGVAVVTVKPGPVDTPMTRGLDRLPLLISADEAARQTLAAARRRVPTAYVPRTWQPIMFALRQVPSALFRRLNV
jgi:NAD(P)-dependent dehydrogenase (short-subunit alcohol dehydrogenase family)